MAQDKLAGWLYGHECAVRLPNNPVFLRRVGGKTLIATVALECLTSTEEDDELWIGDVILLPNQRHRGSPFRGKRIDQIMVRHWNVKECWGEPFWKRGLD